MATHHVRPDDRTFIVRLRRGAHAIGIVPLVARRLPLFGVDVMLLAPLSEQYNTHSDLLLEEDSEHAVAAFVRAIQGLPVSWDCFRMARLLDEGPVARALRGSFAHQELAHHEHDGLAAYELALPAAFADYLAQRSAKFRNHLKRTERKLRAAGELAVHTVASADQFQQGYDALLAVERASWKHQHGTAITAVPRQVGFYRDFGLEAFHAGRLDLQLLTLNGQPIAFNLGYLLGQRYHYLKTSYAAAFRQLSPATYLRACLIERLIGRGVTHFDFPG